MTICRNWSAIVKPGRVVSMRMALSAAEDRPTFNPNIGEVKVSTTYGIGPVGDWVGGGGKGDGHFVGLRRSQPSIVLCTTQSRAHVLKIVVQ